jgi:gas vesicle protein
MFRRKSKVDKAKRAVAGRLPTTEEVRGQVAEVTDELSDALEAAREAITKAMSSASRRTSEASAEATRRATALGKQASRKSAKASRKASRQARDAAFEAVGRRIPDPDQVADMTRRATEKLFPEQARQSRKAAASKRRRRMMAAGAGVAGLGMLIGWLTAPKKGQEARQALKERANAASDKVAEMRATTGPQGPASTSTGTGTESGLGSAGTAGSRGPDTAAGAQGQTSQGADVTPIHPGDATGSKRR